ncbi:MAG TPA: ACT domain-containing protein, partial [Anaeromyxobacteraceae bacterium]
VRRRTADGGTELTLTAPDRPGLLSLVTGVLAANRIDIRRAEVFSTAGDARLGWLAGRALDLFEVRGPDGGPLEPARWRAARDDLRRVLSGEEALDSLVAPKLRASPIAAKPLPGVATKVVIDNDSSRDASVIDVFTADRTGLLHTLSRTFFELGLTVDLARIATEGHRAADAFYVRTAEGGRLEGERARRVAAALEAALQRS